MLYESRWIEPLEFRNAMTGEVKVVVYGGVIELPESVGRLYPNYLKQVSMTLPEEVMIEDIQSEIVRDFNGTSERQIQKEDEIGKLILDGEEKKTEKVKKAGRPRVWGKDVPNADKRFYQRKAKKEREQKFKDLGMGGAE